MRCLIAVALLTSMVASAAQAKLNPTFSERVAETGDLVAIDVGEGSQHFLGPLRIYLVPLHAADQLKGEADPRLLKIGELGTAGEFGTPRVLRFEVPDLPAGDYTAAIWFRGYETGTWADALEGIHPLLTIEAADEGETTMVVDEGTAAPDGSGEAAWPDFWAVILTTGVLAAGIVGLGWRRAGRRSPGGASAN